MSGAFVVNSRRQSLALDAAVPGSPFGLADTPDDCLSDLELNDDEFAAEEQAHRWGSTRRAEPCRRPAPLACSLLLCIVSAC